MCLDLNKQDPRVNVKTPKLGDYNGKGDPDEHIQLVNDWIDYYSAIDASKCKLKMLAYDFRHCTGTHKT